MAMTVGDRLGPFEIVSALGAGGMGEVYRARDSRLHRDVALKILPEAFATDPDRVARFRREAQVLASLSHPNIGHIYGFEESTMVHALVLELIEGPTLADRIAEGPIPLAEGLALDPRTDLWSLGVVLYEMLTQRLPFAGPTAQRTIVEILRQPTPPLPGIPRELQRIVERCLEKERSARYPSADALVNDLDACAESVTPDRPLNVRAALSVIRRPRLALPASLILLTLASTAGWWWHRSSMREWAVHEAVPQAHTLADTGRFLEAYRLAIEAERYIADAPALNDLWPDVARRLSVRSDPPDAEVAWQPYGDDTEPWQALGVTPIVDRRLPAGPARLRIVKAGYVTAEVAASSSDTRITLFQEGSVPADMVRVPAGRLSAQYSGIGDLSATVGAFDIDRHEVSNRQFKNFVAAGGYRTRAFWTTAFIENGREVSWEAAMARFVDPTGRPGPATWEAGSYPEGRDDYPVTGLSWYEAAAYATFLGRSLPTVYHWFRAANTDDSRFLIARSNFEGTGPLPVERSGALGSFGTIDMAGNAREWCWNETAGQRYILGGSWTEPS